MRIKICNVSKTYQKAPQDYLLKHKRQGNGKAKYALQDVNLTIEDGSRVGIIGSNGAGKTTLLHILSGYTKPTSGSVTISGTIASVMEIGSSIDEMQTGRENILTAGRFYCSNEEELKRKANEIISFIDLGDYIDQPLKIYSSGMKAKVSFGCILFIQPEILIIDEVLGVGDAEFSKKSIEKTRELCNAGKILLMVSHSMSTIREFTNRCIWMEQGKVIADGSSEEITFQYEEFVKKKEHERARLAMASNILQNEKYSNSVEIQKLEICCTENKDPSILTGDPLKLEFDIKVLKDINQGSLMLEIINMRGECVLRETINENGAGRIACKAGKNITGSVSMLKFMGNQGHYTIKLSILSGEMVVGSDAVLLKVTNQLYFYHTAIPEIILEDGEIT